MVGSRPSLITQILHALVGRLTRSGDGGSIEEDVISAIRALTRLVPSCSQLLMPTIEYHFPFHSRPINEHVSYVQNILHLATLMPPWKYKILELIIGRALVLDVELQNDAEQLKNMDLCKETTTAGEESDGLGLMVNADQLTRRSKLRAVRTGTRKLDQVLELIFSHVRQFITIDGRIDEQRSQEMFAFMLMVFEKTILPTFKSRYTQFLTFYMTSLCPALADQFLGLLFKPLVQFCQSLDHGRNSMPSPRLLLSVTYIGSFVARARFLSDKLLQLSFEMLIDLSARLRLKTTIGSPRILRILALQHILYIFHKRSGRLLARLGMEEIIELFDILLEDASILQHCNAEVVAAFLEVADDKLDLLPEGIIEEYHSQRESHRNGRFKSKYEDLEFYFPFDPIELTRCRVFITDEMYQLEEDEPSQIDDSDGSIIDNGS